MKLDDRIMELIAIGASITANCQPCLEYHTGKAKEYGADEQEIQDAIQVGKTVRRGAAAKMDKYAASFNVSGLNNEGADKGCGCSLS
ncbi:carboxymuconolactone decarboxylase family protein [Geomonas subterranea]|uniref:Carboxymuconolactone decarboxylase family protein n=1 Tax=Geomonas subterranea TaxID=2847989 RepID=A0ABX8LCF4_9BACT|nr:MULTISPECIES: carboxymuconolactone decarboxylase family protein [Geomonas]QXE89703.1 carboxymuconolactone decarboxylase family protein [Geomonas subterranea]QXM08182.1 carboxymuconolactone decarboxylase family protein [Geomonas subterranea]